MESAYFNVTNETIRAKQEELATTSMAPGQDPDNYIGPFRTAPMFWGQNAHNNYQARMTLFAAVKWLTSPRNRATCRVRRRNQSQQTFHGHFSSRPDGGVSGCHTN